MSADERVTVTGPVTASLGPVWLGLFPPKESPWTGDPDDWDEGPADEEAEAGRTAVLADLRRQLTEHGFDPPEFHIETARPRPIHLGPSGESSPW